ncbi:MAG: anti-sigma factor antagonist [Clostridia bacterium]|nr:anti-sigma factor antagonist [Clostridia bacterium]
MTVDYEQLGDVLYARLSGELDEHTASSVRASLDNLIEVKHFRCLVLDFKDVDFMDSTGVGMVLGRFKKLKKSGKSLLLKRPNSQVLKVFKSCGLLEILETEI